MSQEQVHLKTMMASYPSATHGMTMMWVRTTSTSPHDGSGMTWPAFMRHLSHEGQLVITQEAEMWRLATLTTFTSPRRVTIP